LALSAGRACVAAAGLSSATITRLSKQWTDDYHAFRQGDLSVDGIPVNVRLDEDKLCLLVVGIHASGRLIGEGGSAG
jgi:putative transposase